MTEKRDLLKIIQIPAKKKRKRHPPGGHYWGPLKDTPKKYQSPPPVNV
tara:strand:- start:103 stop:246 length:144 start_codon:yes stop_codon:yes gene_type:complete